MFYSGGTQSFRRFGEEQRTATHTFVDPVKFRYEHDDGAFVGEGSLGSVTKGTGALSPGAGIRYYASVGPIRVDVGYNPGIAEDLPVVTEDGGRIVQLRDPTTGKALTRRYQP